MGYIRDTEITGTEQTVIPVTERIDNCRGIPEIIETDKIGTGPVIGYHVLFPRTKINS